jgi:predicted tellurium resistance membrane protein TerC
MKTKYQHAAIIFGIIFSILAVIMYISGVVAAQYDVFLTGIFFQIIGAILIGIAKREHKKTKEQDRLDLERLTRENEQFHKDSKRV